MATEQSSWQVDITNSVPSNTAEISLKAETMSEDKIFSAGETVFKDFQILIRNIFSLEERCQRTLENIDVHKGVNLTEVLSRLESIIPSHNGRVPPIDTYNHISILSQHLQSYIQLLNDEQINSVANKVEEDSLQWITSMFGLDNSHSIFHNQKLQGLLKVCRLALHSKYTKYATDGFTALYTRPPVVYISSAAPPEFSKQLRNELGLPQSSICTVPCNTMNGSPFAMDIAAFERLLTDDVSCGKTPLIVIAYAGTPLSGHTDNLGRLREICTQSGVWLHIEGDTLANLTMSHIQPSVRVATTADSVTLNLSKWFGMPVLPYCTLYKINNPTTAVSANVLTNPVEKLTALPVWIIVQFMGIHDLKTIIEHAFGLSQQMCSRLDIINGVKRIEQPTGISPVVIFKYKSSPTLPLTLTQNEGDNSKTRKSVAAPRGKIEVSPKLADAFNKMIVTHLHEVSPNVYIESVHVPREGICLKFSPLLTSRSYGTSKNDVDDFIEKLQLYMVQMDNTLINRNAFQETFQRIPDVVLIDLVEEPAIGTFQCIPKYWKTKTMSNLSDLKKHEANELNKSIFMLLSHHYHCLQEHILPNGQICIQVGIVDNNFNLQQFGEIVLKCTLEMEDNAKFVESIQDSVQASIKEAQDKLARESDEQFLKEGVLRNVPLVSSLYNWWSPPPKENHGVTGKSFDLSSGKLESTDKTYKYKMQIQDDDLLERSSQMSLSSRASSQQPHAPSIVNQSQDDDLSDNDDDGDDTDGNDDDDLSEVDSDDNEQDTTVETLNEGEEVQESDV